MVVIKRVNLLSIFGLNLKDNTAIIGCGGKTSLMYALALENRDKAVLITTTTQILRPSCHIYDFEAKGELEAVKNGICLLYGEQKHDKLFAPHIDELERAKILFDYVFIEADGSKNCPLKGWAEYEPVIPDFMTATIGVATPAPIGEALSEKNTHRLPIFSGITCAVKGEVVTAAHIGAMISSPFGMLQKAVGKRIVFINQVESENDRAHALEIFDSMPEAFLQSLSRVVIGSIKQNSYEVIWRGGQ